MDSKDNGTDDLGPALSFLCPSDWLADCGLQVRQSLRRKEVTLEWSHLCVPFMVVCRLSGGLSPSFPGLFILLTTKAQRPGQSLGGPQWSGEGGSVCILYWLELPSLAF